MSDFTFFFANKTRNKGKIRKNPNFVFMSEKKSQKYQKYLIVIGGATASGKTALAIRLAQHFDTEIISADSRQFYREMSIGTAKPTSEELTAVKHHFVDNLSIHDFYSVGDFERESRGVLATIFSEKNVAIAVGGTGLYLKALCEGIDEFPETPLSIRTKWQGIFEEKGLVFLQNQLEVIDPQYFTEVDIQNPMRLIRALSVWEATGEPFSSFRTKSKQMRSFTPIYLQTDMPREVLYERINRRVDLMMQAGLLAEAEQFFAFRHLTSLQTVGYTELFDFFEKKYTTLDEAVDKIKQHTRNYAKRQLTWFRRENHWLMVNPTDFEGVLSVVSM